MQIRTPRGQRPSRQARSHGQALIWMLGTMAASAAVLYAVFNTSQLLVGKQRTVNAADAAAIAGATVEARLLNLVAYNNRSIMANEAFLIQMISLESWLQYLRRTADNMGYVVDVLSVFVPPVAAVAKFLHQSASVAEKVHGQLVNVDNNAVLPALKVLKESAAVAHKAVLAAGGALAENAAIGVVNQNRAAFKTHADAGMTMENSVPVRALTLGLNITAFSNFTSQYKAGDRGDAANVLLASRDDFSASRPGRGWMNANFGLIGTEKNGGSQLHNFERWETQDTLEIWEKHPCKKGMCKDYIPIGWGRSNADKNGSTAGTKWSPGRSAQSLARSDATKHSNWSGVPELYDIAPKLKKAPKTDPLGLDFTVVVRRPQANTTTSESLAMGVATEAATGSSEMPQRLNDNQLTAIARARVSFERPRRGLLNDITGSSLWRSDNAKEYGSLYSPYWQARLTDMTLKQKAALLMAMGMIIPDEALYTPGGQK
ncbi:pilus assembly protein TadG-related protein [Ideonella margarita]|uniref:Pilus assembly protein TadG-related protein n=1 Tax=Ideonella margarita TaxID=2984191 RepID=A0ABU9C7F1_9BURK